jgi:DNA-binding CsgD family transcriptional regulator
MELRVAALVKGMLPSWKIAEMLGICEETVENHRVNIRHKLGLKQETLFHYLRNT